MAHELDELLESLRAPLLYAMPGMEAVTARRDIAYRGVAENAPRMDVHTPANLRADERRPAILFLHGGPVSPELPLPATEWGVYRGYGALAAASGWVGVTFTHRFNGFDHLELAADDIAAALAYVREHADELGVDANRLCLWAFSGGGAFLADALREPLPYIRCLVAYYCVMDLRPLESEEGIAESVTPEVLRRFSPVAAVEGLGTLTLPLLVARAGHDHPALNSALDAFVAAALSANAPLDLMNHTDGVHAFDTRSDNARTREIISQTLAFLHARLDA